MELRAALERPTVRWSLVAVAAIVALHLVALVLLVGLQRTHSDRVLPGVAVADTDVGGLTHGQLVEVVDDRADGGLARTVRITTTPADPDATADGAASPESAAAELETDRAAIGVEADTAATVSDAWDRGRRGLWRALIDQLRARAGGTLEVPLRTDLDDDHLDDWAGPAARELSVAARDGAVELSADGDVVEVVVVDAHRGTDVDPAVLRDRVRDAVSDGLGHVHVQVSADHETPAITAADVDAVLGDAELAVSAPVELVNPSPVGDDLRLAPADLAAVLEVVADPEAAEGERLAVTTDGWRLADHLGDDAVGGLGSAPVDAAVTLTDGEVAVEPAADGFGVDLDEVADAVLALATVDDDRTGELPGEPAEPDVSTADAEAVADQAEVLVSAPVVLTNPSAGDDLELDPAALADVLRVEVVVGDDGPALDVTSSGDALVGWLGDDGVASLEEPPQELEVALVDGALSVDGGTPGFALDADAAAEVVVELAGTADDRSAQLPGATAQPELTQDELEDLGVTEVVSSFTTDLVPGEPRNTNIHRAAELIHGDLIRPGETYSLNQGIGQRTAERGFVENGFIEDGELVSVTGGGVSQMGTTFMNAAWFAGVSLPEFHPHSLSFARYPMGREATLAWGVLDVVVDNDSPHAIMVLTSWTDASVTVAFASTGWAQVDSWTGEPYDVVPGEERDGFTIDFGRDITYPDGSTGSESYTHTYDPDDG